MESYDIKNEQRVYIRITIDSLNALMLATSGRFWATTASYGLPAAIFPQGLTRSNTPIPNPKP